MKKNLFFVFILIVLTLFVGCNGDSSKKEYGKEELRHSRFRRDRSRIDRMADDLDLSGGQLEELRKLEKEIDEKRFAMMRDREERECAMSRITGMIRSDSLSKEEILQFMEELHSAAEERRAEIDSFTAERLAKMHFILTKEQREKLAKKIEEFKPKRDKK